MNTSGGQKSKSCVFEGRLPKKSKVNVQSESVIHVISGKA